MAVVSVDNGAGGARILIEVDESDGEAAEAAEADLADIYGEATRGGLAEKVIRLSRPLFSEALDLVESCAEAMHARLEAMTDAKPDELEMQLAVKLDTKAGAKIVELAGGAQLQVVMRWTGLRTGDADPG
ncbi:CU044_2847 family protein [Actinomadura opuntiae]|uniref:CU044_2847 family protein n=1 Tax=Actinomadura sp. OS1-43 TaxID=604315 RepID=UPI00255AD518|nr:CU044_2847 family protein [Actinomadura sp. OS1-43]MDL4813612.1 CU044_2847 family protein [Actinomadura sp. OS1-43]